MRRLVECRKDDEDSRPRRSQGWHIDLLVDQMREAGLPVDFRSRVIRGAPTWRRPFRLPDRAGG
jgi:hypothetical protein